MKIFFSGRIPKDTGGSAAVSRRARFQYPFHRQTAQRVKWSASDATKMARLRRVIFNKHENAPKTGKFSGYFRAISVPALPAKRARAATPFLVTKGTVLWNEAESLTARGGSYHAGT